MTTTFDSKRLTGMKRFLASGLGGAMLLLAGCGGEPEQATTEELGQKEQRAGWVQTWSDEFNGTSVDQSNWTMVTNVHRHRGALPRSGPGFSRLQQVSLEKKRGSCNSPPNLIGELVLSKFKYMK